MTVINRNAGSSIFDTFDIALTKNMRVGQVCIVKGQVTATDGLGAQYQVKANGSGGIQMTNGNELVILDGETLKPNSAQNLAGLVGTVTGQQISLKGYHAGSNAGGGAFVWGTGRHNGGTFIDPNRAYPDWGVPAEVTAWFLDSGGDVDGWRRIIKNNKIDSADFSVTPDGVTDWGDTGNGILRHLLTFSSTTKTTVVFTPGHYASTFDNYWSDVSVHFEKGAIFGGTIHAAINNDINSPASQRPSNVRFTGDVASYQRVGSYNCDKVFIESIRIYDDASKDYNGYRGAGIHFYNGSTDMVVGDVYIENSEQSYGFGVDTNDAANPPKNIYIKSITVKESRTHGGYIKGDGIFVGNIVIENFGTGLLTDPNISASLPGYTGGAITSFRGFVCESSGEVRIGSITIKGDASNTDSSFGFENRNNSTAVNFGDVRVRDTVSHGILNYGTFIANSANLRVCGSRGLYNASGSINIETIDCAQNVGTSLYIDGGVFESRTVKVSDDITGGIAFVNAPELKVSRIYCANTNSGSSSQAQILLANTTKGRIDSISVLRNGAFESTSVTISRSGSGVLSIGNLESNGGGDTASSTGAVQITGDNFHIDSIDIKSSVFTGLRLVSGPNSFSIKGGRIDNSTAGIATDTPVGLTNAGFMNVKNDGSTNINALGVNVFNCVNVTL